MDEVITGCVNPLFMGPTVRLDLTTLIFGLADELEGYLRAMGSKRGSAGIENLRDWTRTWIDEQQGALAEKLLREGARETTP
jgi:hypothetical protein